MLIDKENTFDWEAALTADRVSTNVIDLLPNGGAVGAGETGGPDDNLIRDIGAGKTLYLHALVTTTLSSSPNDSSLIITLESDDATDLAGSATVHLTLPEVEAADLVAGTWLAKGVPVPAGAFQRYLGVRYNVGAEEDFTAGAVSAWLSENRYDDRTYESGWTTGIN